MSEEFRLAFIFVFFVYLNKFIKQVGIVKSTDIFKKYDSKKDFINIIKIGLPVTIAYQVANITLNLDNQFVSLLFSTQKFAQYSFAYNLISIIIPIALAVSTVLFPYLNSKKREEVLSTYSNSISYMLVIVYFMLISFYIIEAIVHGFLPKYVQSLKYFRILLPGVAITACVSSIVFNYYNATRDIGLYLKNGCISLVLSFIVDLVIYEIFRSVTSMAVASLL